MLSNREGGAFSDGSREPAMSAQLSGICDRRGVVACPYRLLTRRIPVESDANRVLPSTNLVKFHAQFLHSTVGQCIDSESGEHLEVVAISWTLSQGCPLPAMLGCAFHCE